jgi:hypothetical protein
LLTRRGEFEAAREQLDLALAEQVRDGRSSEALATTTRLLELEVAMGSSETVPTAIEEALSSAHRTEGGSVFVPALRRLRGTALVQIGRGHEGVRELRAGLDDARRRRDLYETALILDVLARLPNPAGADTAAFQAELADLSSRLGITTLLEMPLDNERTAQTS